MGECVASIKRSLDLSQSPVRSIVKEKNKLGSIYEILDLTWSKTVSKGEV